MSERVQGKVKFFDKSKGFGFIAGNDGRDYFVGANAVEDSGLDSLMADQVVSFDSEPAKRPKQSDRAINLRTVD